MVVPRRRRSDAGQQLDPLFDDIEKRTFNFFWETAEARHRPRARSLAERAVREHRGRRLRAQRLCDRRGARLCHARAGARARADDAAIPAAAPQGPDPANSAGYQGFFYHFLNFGTGKRYGNSELSTVDTALFMAGVLFVQGYFDGDMRKKWRSAKSRKSCIAA